jgi:hypothetical protein
VPTSVAPTVTFNEAINPVSVLSASPNTGIWLRRQTGSVLIPVAYSFSADSKVVTLTPLAPLDAGTIYNVVVSSGISDLAGNVYPTTTQITFTTTP